MHMRMYESNLLVYVRIKSLSIHLFLTHVHTYLANTRGRVAEHVVVATNRSAYILCWRIPVHVPTIQLLISAISVYLYEGMHAYVGSVHMYACEHVCMHGDDIHCSRAMLGFKMQTVDQSENIGIFLLNYDLLLSP